MIFRSLSAAALAAVLLGAAHRPPPLVVYGAPAGDRPAGASGLHPTDAVLPSGRIAAPAGTSIFVGTNPLGMALSPDGKYVVVSNDSQRRGGLPIPATEPPPAIGYSLAVVDAKTMGLASVYTDPSAAFFMGVATLADPTDASRTLVLASDGTMGAVRVFTLDPAGQLVPSPPSIQLQPVAGRRPFPAGIAVSDDGRFAYVADNLGGTVDVVDISARTVVRTIAAGNFPFSVATTGSRVVVSASGLGSYSPLNAPAREPQFAAPAYDPQKASALSVIDVASGDADPPVVRMDSQPDGTTLVGGDSPESIVLSKDGRLAYVALSNVDRVAVVTLDSDPKVARGLDLRLYPNAPFGAEPSAQALSRDGKRLYVALAGLNAVAVLDAKMPTRYRYGLIPTGWYPIGLNVSPDGRYLYILDAKGVDGWGMLQRVDLKHVNYVKTTLDALKNNRTASYAKFNSVVPPLRSNKKSAAIDRVVYIAVGTQTYDAMLGDLTDAGGSPHGNGASNFTGYPESATPNLHALARDYALADNFYASDPNLDISRTFALGADVPLYTHLVANVNSARTPLTGHGDDPEDYGRFGYIFNAFARAQLSYRDYGGLLQLSGYNEGEYHYDVPALGALGGNVDLAYAGANTKVDDAHRAQEFVRDMQALVDADREPNFTYVWLPTAARSSGVAEADRALGTIVDFLSKTPHWSSTAIFIVPEGVDGGTDHVNGMRSYALVVSPLAKRAYVGHAHLSVPSVIKTEEEIFGLGPLTLNDLLATDLADFFADAPNPQPYQAIR